MSSDLRSVASLLRARSSGRLSARDCLEQHLERIAAARRLNAVVVLDEEAARRRADAADAAARAGYSLGPLHGIPMTVKESFDVAGLPSTFGHPNRATHRATAHALAVARLVEAGANIFGKTNVPKDLADWQSFNEIYGETLNPWNEALSPGGSSGGAAAALAAGLTPLELGSDIGGSIRIPAHFCGVFGHKPTFGIVPMRGHAMREGAASGDITVGGPLATSAEDLDLALRLLAGPDPEEGGAWRLALPPEPRDRLSTFRVALIADDAEFPVDEPIVAAHRRLAENLRRAGAIVDEDARLPIASRDAYELYLSLLRGATSARLGDAAFDTLARKAAEMSGRDDYEALMTRGLTQSHRDWLQANDRRHALRAGLRAFFDRYDAIICPVATTPAFPREPGIAKQAQTFSIKGERRPAADTYFWLALASLPNLPATVVPLGPDEAGRPIGTQIIGREFGDFTCLRLARLIEDAFGGFTPPPATAG